MAQGLVDRALRDLVEHDPLDVHSFESRLFGKHRVDMPGDRLALAIGVGCEVEMPGALDRLDDRGKVFLRPRNDLPLHRETVIREDGPILFGQVPDMAIAREHGVTAGDVFRDGLRLGRRFDDDDIHYARRPLIHLPAGD